MSVFWLDQPSLTFEQRNRVAAASIPVEGFNPGTYWIACLEDHSVMPTAKELAAIRSYVEFTLADRVLFSPNFAKKEKTAKFAAAAGFNTVVFRKDEDGWYCRRITWTEQMWSSARATLIEMLDADLLGSANLRWSKWKIAHKTVFATK